MSAIPRKERVFFRLPIERFKKVRFSKRALSWLLTTLLIIPLCVFGLSVKPHEVRFNYATVKGCIDEEKIRTAALHQSIFQLLGWGGARLKNEYECLEGVAVRYLPLATIEVRATTKEAVFGVQAYHVGVNDVTGWKEVFSRPRAYSELYFVAKDGTVTYFDQGASVPRITYLEDDERSPLSRESIQLLITLHSLLEQRDKSAPKLDVFSNSVVKVSAVSFEELYLPLDETMEAQLKKAYAVALFLSLRGTSVVSIDARMRDIVVSAR